MDAIAQIVSLRSAQFVTEERQASDGSAALEKGFRIVLSEFLEPLDNGRIAFLLLIKNDLGRGHRMLG